MTRPQYEPTISLGNMIVLAGVLLGVMGPVLIVWVSIERHLAANDGRLTPLESSMVDMERRGRENESDLRVAIQRVDDKLTALLLHGYRPGDEFGNGFGDAKR